MAAVAGVLQLIAIHRKVAAPLCLAQFVVLLCGTVAEAETIRVTLKNGDTINAVLLPEESSETLKVLIHPQLGRLEVSRDAIQSESKKHQKRMTELKTTLNQMRMQNEYLLRS